MCRHFYGEIRKYLLKEHFEQFKRFAAVEKKEEFFNERDQLIRLFEFGKHFNETVFR